MLGRVYRESDVGRLAVGRSKQVDGLLRALAHPLRRAMVEMLVERDTDATEFTIVGFLRFGLAPSTTSEHLRILRESGLVHRRAEGSCRVFSLAVEAPDLLARWAERIASREPGDWVPYEEE